jgi:DNA polymerase-4
MVGRYVQLCEHVFVSSILHADLDSFFASVEQRDEPSLKGKPVIVGTGVVLAASYEAKAFGVRTAMGPLRARRLCPQAVVVPARFKAYSEASKAVFKVFEDTAPVVEALSIDEAFIDVRGMERSVGTPLEIARRLRRRVRDEVGLPITVGVARTKFLAKVASGVAKPDGLLLVPPDDELDFLHPLDIERLWGVGPVTSRRLRDVGIDEGMLIALVGRAQGRRLYALAHNRDPRRVETRRRRGSIGSQRARGRRPWTPGELDADVVALVDRITHRMRKARRVGRTVVLRLRFDDFTRATRSHTLLQATSSTETVLRTARELLGAAIPMLEERGVTLVGISVANLDDALPRQLALPLERRLSADLDEAIDVVRERFGSKAITRGVLVGRGEGIEMPLLPD